MRTRIAILLACAAGFAAAAGPAESQGRDRQACFYRAPDFQGRRFCVDAGQEARRLPPDWDDRISSIEIDRGVTVEACDRPRFRGRCRVYDRSVPFLGRRSDDRVSSFRVERLRRRPIAMACFYERPDFRGRQFCAEPGDVGNRLPPGWDNRISSIQIQGGAIVELCPFPGLNGRCRIVERDTPFVGPGLGNRISSYRVDDGRRPGPGGRDGRFGPRPPEDGRFGPPPGADEDEDEDEDEGESGPRGGRDGARDGRDRRGDGERAEAPPAENRVCFFEHRDFGGRELCVNAGETLDRLPRGFDDRISSMRNWGRAVAHVCDQPGFRGECRIYDSSDNYVGDRWNDRFSSIRVGRK